MTNSLRSELSTALAASTDRLRAKLGAELARLVQFNEGCRFQFEVDPYFFGIASCATEEPILLDNWLDEVLPEDWFDRAEASEGGWNKMISEELCPWFAECWQAVRANAVTSPAYLFFHGNNEDQYNLDRGFWMTASEAFGE